MEDEIKKLKIEYQSTTPPKFLVDSGISDLWNRVDNQKRFIEAHFVQFLALGILILIIMSGFIGVISAQAKPGSTLYFVKKFTQKAVRIISNTQINPIKPTVSPSLSPSETIEEKKGEKDSNLESNQNRNNNHEEVKGVKAFENARNSENKASENSHGKNDNSKNDESQDHSSDGNTNGQNNEGHDQEED